LQLPVKSTILYSNYSSYKIFTIMANEKINLSGFGWDKTHGCLNKSPQPIPSTEPYSDYGTQHFGMPITVEAFSQMISKFAGTVSGGNAPTSILFKDILCVDFSKSSIFRILSQENCEFVRFYFCIPEDNGRISLVLEGLNTSSKPIKLEQVKDALQSLKANQPRQLDVYSDPNYEERGNGGIGGGFVSLREKVQKYLADHPQIEDINVEGIIEAIYGK
jgi:hypothetical protein